MATDSDVAIGLAKTLLLDLLANEMLVARLRVYYNLFVPSTERVVHVILCNSQDAARALLQACSTDNVHFVYNALHLHAVIDSLPFDEFMQKVSSGNVLLLAEMMDWTKKTIVYVSVTVRSSTRNAFALATNVTVPTFVRDDVSARDDKRSVFAAFERVLVGKADGTQASLQRSDYVVAFPTLCETCGKLSPYSVCGACMIVCYCSRECQRARFDMHSTECQHFRVLYDYCQQFKK